MSSFEAEIYRAAPALRTRGRKTATAAVLLMKAETKPTPTIMIASRMPGFVPKRPVWPIYRPGER